MIMAYVLEMAASTVGLNILIARIWPNELRNSSLRLIHHHQLDREFMFDHLPIMSLIDG